MNVYITRPNQNALKTWSIICLRPCCWVTEAKRTLNQMTCFEICDCYPVENVVWTFTRHASSWQSENVLSKFPRRIYWKPLTKHYQNQIARFFANECKTWGKPHVNVYITRPNQNALKTWSIICLRPCCWVTEAKRTLNQMTCFEICDCYPVENVV